MLKICNMTHFTKNSVSLLDYFTQEKEIITLETLQCTLIQGGVEVLMENENTILLDLGTLDLL